MQPESLPSIRLLTYVALTSGKMKIRKNCYAKGAEGPLQLKKVSPQIKTISYLASVLHSDCGIRRGSQVPNNCKSRNALHHQHYSMYSRSWYSKCIVYSVHKFVFAWLSYHLLLLIKHIYDYNAVTKLYYLVNNLFL